MLMTKKILEKRFGGKVFFLKFTKEINQLKIIIIYITQISSGYIVPVQIGPA